MIFGKDKVKKLSDLEKKAKLDVLKDAYGVASGMLKDKVSGVKKVTVASDSKEGLKKGLEKGLEIIGKNESEDEEIIGENESEDEEMGESDESKSEGYEDQQEESEPTSVAEINAKIEELMKLKEKLSK